jgi:hypothetical protein
MNRRQLVGALLGATSLLLLPACDGSVTGRSFEPIRYKIAAVVETPQGLKSGYSVLEYQGSMAGSMFGGMAGSGFSVKGEAVAVDVAPGQVMFVLLHARGNFDFPATVLNAIKVPESEGPSPKDRAGQMARTERMYDQIRANRNVYPLWRPEDQRPGTGPWNGPYFVRFRNINDPKSVEQVDPDDLAKTFGTGFKLKALTIQVTDEPVTTGIENRLPWLKSKTLRFADETRNPKTGYLAPPKHPTVANNLNDGSFIRR